ncbi:MAG: flavodoxin family protein [Methanomassiliicoccaceae archaeon]|jgi:multimeric flavodoxin WrbA|nr:flavodoxin family protein [Methanomassiliicoccaceae archaeon]
MNVLFITGSAREGGITAKLCDIVASAMPGADITFVRPHEMDIRHCSGCGSCAASGKCTIGDDMHRIYQMVAASDIVILATPIYFSGPSSIMKQVIDRFQCVWATGKGKRKDRTAALIAAGGDAAPIFSNAVSIAKAFAVTIGARWAGELKASGTDGMKEIPEDLAREARSFGSDIASKHPGA